MLPIPVGRLLAGVQEPPQDHRLVSAGGGRVPEATQNQGTGRVQVGQAATTPTIANPEQAQQHWQRVQVHQAGLQLPSC